MILTAHPIVNSSRLMWESTTRQFVGEISDLGAPLTRVYDDACDVGFTLQRRDGRESVAFVVNETHRDAEGDVTHWVLVPADFRDRGFTVLLFND